MELLQSLLDRIYDNLIYACQNYFRFTTLFFLIFWVILPHQLAHFRIQPRAKTKTKLILQEIGFSFSSFLVIGVINWFFDLVIPDDRYGLFYDNYYNEISTYGWTYFVLSVFLMLVFDDTYFYWMHRLLHHPKLYYKVHKVHHYSVDPNPFTTYSFHPLETAILFFGYRLVPSIIPVHHLAVNIWLLLTLLNSIVIHLGYEIYPQWFTKSPLTNWKTPSTHHNMHHEQFKGNYGLIFTWWDKLMGTEFPNYQSKLEAVQHRKIVLKNNN
jgi:sterol desaturase/sphingolipid hydroxylase (fatty acid hydroxylase superfamily)